MAITNNLESSEEIKKPSLIKILLPFVLAGGILAWIFSAIDIDSMQEVFRDYDVTQSAWVMMIVAAVLILCDAMSFGIAYRWFLKLPIAWWEIVSIRATTQLVFASFTPLAPLVSFTYLYKRWNIGIFRAFCSNTLTMFIDVSGGMTLVSIALVLGLGEIAWYFYVLALSHWLFTFSVLTYFKSNLFNRFKLPVLLQTVTFPFIMARYRQIAAVYLARVTHVLSVTIVTGVMLSSMSIDLALWQLLIFGPIIFGSAALPISAGGYGGPQGVAILFLVEIWEFTNTETALALSLVWSTLFLCSRVLLGLVGFVPFWLAIQHKAKLAPQPA